MSMFRALLMAGGGSSVPTAGLLFHAPLAEDLVDRVSGAALEAAAGEVSFADGAATLDHARLSLPGAAFPGGDAPCTLACTVAPTDFGFDNSSWFSDMFGIGDSGDGNFRIFSGNPYKVGIHFGVGDVECEYGWDLSGETWTNLIATISPDGCVLYINGNAVASSDSTELATADPAGLTVGGMFGVGWPLTSGKYKNLLLYDRILSPAEIAAIANL